MQAVFAAFLVALAAIANVEAGLVPATTLFRTPSLDTSVTHTSRVGGSFAYSTAENHAYAAVSPVVETVVAPVAYTTHDVAVPTYTHAAIAAPIAYEPAVVVAK